VTDKVSAGLCPLVSRNSQGEALAQALRLFVGRGARFSYKELQQGTGIPARMIECYRHSPEHEDWRPIKAEELASLVRFLGPEFTTEWLSRVAQQGAFWLPDEDDTPPGAIAADESEDAARISRCAADGDFKGDGVVLRPVALRMIARGHRLARVA